MPFIIRDNNGRSAPVAECDVCHEIVVRHGNVEWLRSDDGEAIAPFYITHKRCSDALAEKLGRWTASIELEQFMAQLIHNMEVNLEEGRRIDDSLRDVTPQRDDLK